MFKPIRLSVPKYVQLWSFYYHIVNSIIARNSKQCSAISLLHISFLHFNSTIHLCSYFRIKRFLDLQCQITHSPCFTLFCFNASCKLAPFFNLRRLIFGSTTFGWLCLTPAYFIISFGNIIFYLRPFDLCPLSGTQLGLKKKGLDILYIVKQR